MAEGLTCGQLSGGQKHLIYLLGVLASRPRLLICDEALCGLDIDRQSSMLTLLQARPPYTTPPTLRHAAHLTPCRPPYTMMLTLLQAHLTVHHAAAHLTDLSRFAVASSNEL